MKTKNLLLAASMYFLLVESPGQTTLILRPGPAEGKDATVGNCVPCGYYNMNDGASAEFIAAAWTLAGAESNGRSFIEFDLDTIPANSTILDAKLSLYFNPVSTNTGHSSLSGSNQCVLRRVTQPWDENTITWENQPATTDTNETIIPQSLTFYQNYPDMDVTKLVVDIRKYPSRGFGFMLKLQNETKYRSMIFATSDHPDKTLHPRLAIVYQTDLGSQEIDGTLHISLSPNPNSGTFRISGTGKPLYSLGVYNVFGARVYGREAIAENERISLNDLPTGVYFVKIDLGKTSVTKKMIVERQ
jgi:hypothetical protein